MRPVEKPLGGVVLDLGQRRDRIASEKLLI
jgi:hypothetical protein